MFPARYLPHRPDRGHSDTQTYRRRSNGAETSSAKDASLPAIDSIINCESVLFNIFHISLLYFNYTLSLPYNPTSSAVSIKCFSISAFKSGAFVVSGKFERPVERIEPELVMMRAVARRRARPHITNLAGAIRSFDCARRNALLFYERRRRINIPNHPMRKTAGDRRIRIVHDERQAFCAGRNVLDLQFRIDVSRLRR